MATATEKWWTKQVAEWRASGLTSDEFGEQRGFSGNLLRNWACRLGKSKKREPPIRFARVERSGAAGPASPLQRGGAIGGGVVVEVGMARVEVGRSADRNTLAMVLELLQGVRR
jgi:hypothetical protein